MTRKELRQHIIEAEGKAKNGYDLAARIEAIVDQYVKANTGKDGIMSDSAKFTDALRAWIHVAEKDEAAAYDNIMECIEYLFTSAIGEDEHTSFEKDSEHLRPHFLLMQEAKNELRAEIRQRAKE